MSPVISIGDPIPPGEWAVDGWRIKIDQGRKAPDDRRVWVASPGGQYQLLSLCALGAITRLWYLNEHILYPEDHHRGGEMVLDFLRDCVDHGVEEAAERNQLRPRSIRRLDNLGEAA